MVKYSLFGNKRSLQHDFMKAGAGGLVVWGWIMSNWIIVGLGLTAFIFFLTSWGVRRRKKSLGR